MLLILLHVPKPVPAKLGPSPTLINARNGLPPFVCPGAARQESSGRLPKCIYVKNTLYYGDNLAIMREHIAVSWCLYLVLDGT